MVARNVAIVLTLTGAATTFVGSGCTSDTGGNGGVNGVRNQTAQVSLAAPTVSDLSAREYPGIHNAVAYHDGFVSGSQPEGERGFDSLKAMGIVTIISVDGAVPEVEKAKARGMRYIHLPIGYNGFDESRRIELTRATRDAIAKGPVYIHCHHGKHRSAGAAAVIAAGLGWMTPDEGVARMKVSGTAPNYTGLFACASGAGLLAVSTLDSISGEFPSVSRPASFVQGMIEVDHAFEHLKAIERAGWTTPQDHPDLVPAAEAGRLADVLRVLTESERAARATPELGKFLHQTSAESQTLEDLLTGAPSPDTKALSAQLTLIGASCKDCHAKYRD